MDNDIYFSDIRSHHDSTTNEIHLSEGVTILLGRKPLDVPRPASIKQETIIEHVVNESCFPPEILHTHATAQAFEIFSQGKLFAITNRWYVKKDFETGNVTVRLFKNRTTLCQ